MCSEGVVYGATNEFFIGRKNVIFHFPISQSFSYISMLFIFPIFEFPNFFFHFPNF